MDWKECVVIEVVPGRLSGAPVLRGSRVRPEDLLANIDQGAAWLADAHTLSVADVEEVLACYRAHPGQRAAAV